LIRKQPVKPALFSCMVNLPMEVVPAEKSI
jgi:hypothetical protein